MQTEDLLDECLRIQAAGGSVEALLARYPGRRAEVEPLLALAATTHRLPRAELSAAARRRMRARLFATLHGESVPAEAKDDGGPGGDEVFLHSLAVRLDMTGDAVRRYLGPTGARQVARMRLLARPWDADSLKALSLVLRCLQAIETRFALIRS